MLESVKSEIDQLTQIQRAKIWRFAESDNKYLSEENFPYFNQHFLSVGGFTSEVSRQIGWVE